MHWWSQCVHVCMFFYYGYKNHLNILKMKRKLSVCRVRQVSPRRYCRPEFEVPWLRAFEVKI